MKSWSMGNKLYLGLGSMLVLLVVAGVLAVNAMSSIQGNMDQAAGQMSHKLEQAGAIGLQAEEAWAGEMGVVVNTFAKDRKSMDSYWDQEKNALKKLSAVIAELKPLLLIEANQAALTKIRADLDVWEKGSAQVFNLCDQGEPANAQSFSRDVTKPAYKEIVKFAEEIRLRAAKSMEDLRDIGGKEYTSARWMMIGMILISLAIGGLIVWVVRGLVGALRNTVTELTNGGEQLAAASSQIASTSQSLSQGSSEQAASLEEVSASMEEMTAMTKRNSENSSQAMAMMTETVTQVDRSNSALQEMVASMGAIKLSSEKVAKINKTIDEIAFQTNILALNAAVEAARAGEAGMGFAVVADEVRNLAQRSAVAAKDTALLIEEAIANSNQGAMKLEQVATAIRAITDSASKVKGLVNEVNEASKQQTQGINQVSTAVTQVSNVTQTAAASAEESAAAAEELSAQSQTVSDLVKQLQSMVEGGSGQEYARPRMVVSRPMAKLGQKPSKPASHATSGASQEDSFPMETTGSGSFRNF